MIPFCFRKRLGRPAVKTSTGPGQSTAVGGVANCSADKERGRSADVARSSGITLYSSVVASPAFVATH